MFSSLVYIVFIVLWVVSFGLSVYGLVDCSRRQAGAFVAASKQTKQRWLIILGIAAGVSFVSNPFVPLLSTLGMLNIVAVVAAAVYIVDVKPAVSQYGGSQGRGGNSGPYGPW